MKKVLFFSVLFFVLIQVKSQEKKDTVFVYVEKKDEFIPSKFFIGFSIGGNLPSGVLGLNVEVPFTQKMAIRMGAGLGTWGSKLNVGLRFEERHKKGWGYGLFFVRSSGLKDYEVDMKITRNTTIGTTTETKKVLMDLKPVNNLSIIFSYNWIIKKQNRFYLDFGYGLRMSNDVYKIKTDSIAFTEPSEKALLVMAPGGVIFGFGFIFGL